MSENKSIIKYFSNNNIEIYDKRLSIINKQLSSLIIRNEKIHFHFIGGIEAIKENRYYDAIIHFSKSLHIWNDENYANKFIIEKGIKKPLPEYIRSVQWLAYSYVKLKKFGDAVKYYSIAISQDKNDYRSYTNRGVCFLHLEKYNEAIDDFSQFIELKEYSPYQYRLRGIARHKISDNKKSISDLKKAIELGDTESNDILQDLFNNKLH